MEVTSVIVSFGLHGVSFKQHHSYDALVDYLAESDQPMWIGEDAEIYASFWSAHIKHEFNTAEKRIGIILDQEVSIPRVVVSPCGDYIAFGYNRNVAFLGGVAMRLVEVRLNSVFYCFFSCGDRVIAIHELGCDGFDVANCCRCWQVTSGIVETTTFNDGVLFIQSDDGITQSVNIYTGEVARTLS